MAKQSLTQLFPELKGKNLPLTIEDGSLLDHPSSPGDFIINVYQAHSHLQPQKNCPSPIISVRFAFPVDTADDRIFTISAGGPFVNTDKLENLAHLVDSHPEWSDRDVERAIADAGAQFGPGAKDEVLRSLPTSALKLLLGEIQITSIEFTARNEQQLTERLPSAILLWHVCMISRKSGRADRKYCASFEPFQGKFVSLTKIPPIP